MKRKPSKKPKPIDIPLIIDQIGAGGDGIGTYQNKLVYIPKSAPGDQIIARALETREEYKGEILTIEKSSPLRVSPPCPHFEHCGGCDLQHITQQSYRDWKITKIKNLLERNHIKPEIFEDPIFLKPASRRRTTLAVLRTKDTLLLGYHQPRSHTITNISQCLILDPVLDDIIKKLRPFLQILAPLRQAVDITLQRADGLLDVVLTGAWGDFTLPQTEILAAMMHDLDIARVSRRENDISAPEILLTRKSVIKTFGALSVPLAPANFLQASDEAENALVNIVLRHAQTSKTIADLFCGAGTFTGHLLHMDARVHGVDQEIQALSAITHPKLTTAKRNLFKEPLSLKELEKFDSVVIDPPRAGAKEQCAILARSTIPKIIYVSCNPATFMRDAKTLIEGGYELQTLTLVDQFVYSAHVEVVGVLTRI